MASLGDDPRTNPSLRLGDRVAVASASWVPVLRLKVA
jgi:hypothetical protein